MIKQVSNPSITLSLQLMYQERKSKRTHVNALQQATQATIITQVKVTKGMTKVARTASLPDLMIVDRNRLILLTITPTFGEQNLADDVKGKINVKINFLVLSDPFTSVSRFNSKTLTPPLRNGTTQNTNL